jgi:hypothetical protein
MTQLYLILGSVNALGKPVELFSSIATGTKDFFYEVLCRARARLAFDAQPNLKAHVLRDLLCSRMRR